ncbi:hypothetical protein [Marinomonas transparens]|uniref:Uncharacterized protein n=1 Tax=Marinomonas transparens TaxID=2795388 RepID=A0A934N156_9GAMM|nr:hypothetical protein [Marinomonas transparens]MBJ7539200.1 hypothetical protein [Marinomonas transparens]
MPANKEPKKEDAQETAPSKKAWKLPIAFVLCCMISVFLSSGITYFFVLSSQPDQDLVKQSTETKTLLADIEKTVLEQDQKIKAIKDEGDVLKLYLRHSSATALKNILLDQELNIQAYLRVMKSAIDDLSNLNPRTTDWNNKYQYQLDLALKGSMDRENLLKLLKTGEPNEKASP